MNRKDSIFESTSYYHQRFPGNCQLECERCQKFYAKIVGRDSIGLWIENPKLETTRARDDNGTIIPPDRRHLEEHMVYVLIPWGNIRSVVHFPMRQGFD